MSAADAIDEAIAAQGGEKMLLRRRRHQAADEQESAHEWVERAKSWAPRDDLLAAEQPVEYVIDGLVPSHKTGAMNAAGGVGKTTVQITMGVCIGTGRPFLGRAVKQGSFVLLSSDDSQDDLDGALARVVKAMRLSDAEIDLVRTKVRLMSLQGLAGTKSFSVPHKGAPSPTGLDDLIVDALGSIPDLQLLGLDTLRHFGGGSTNDEQVITITIAGATEIARRLGCAVLISHHTGKQSFREAVTDMYAGSGSAAIADNCRFVLLLQTATWSDIEAKVERTGRERGDPLVLMSTRGSLLSKPAQPIYMHRDGFLFERIAGKVLTFEQQLDARDRSILQAVRGGARTKTDILARVGGRKAAVFDQVDDLVERGHLLNGSQNGSASRPEFVVSSSGAQFLEAVE